MDYLYKEQLIDEFVVFDDAIYSGEQVINKTIMQIIRYFQSNPPQPGRRPRIILAVTYMTNRFLQAVKDNVEGEQTFSIETLSGNNVDSQQVGVTIEPSNQLGSLFKGNGLIWVIGAINLLLIIVIIIVAVKIARR